MVKKTLGYVELEWKCPNCGTMNPGPQKFCSACGTQQPPKVEFQQQAEEKLIADEAEIAKAKAGPDVHCTFCGARNPATAEKCTQCGADLTSANARQSGQVLGALRDQPAAPVKCPQCGAENPATAARCSACNASLKRPEQPKVVAQAAKAAPKVSPALLIVGALVLLFVCVGCVLAVLSMLPREAVTGTVSGVAWERTLEIEELGDVTKSAWKDEVPSDARLGSCSPKVHHTQDNPAPGAKEVCGTAYTVDTGTGHGEVVQDCKYEVYKDWCSYTVKEWKSVDTLSRSGSDFNPQWPNVSLRSDQREGRRSETYQVFFSGEKKDYTYTTGDENQFRQCQIGSRWKLEINMLGGIKSIERAP